MNDAKNCHIINWSTLDCFTKLIPETQWVVISKKNTYFGVNFLASILDSYEPFNTVVGRFACKSFINHSSSLLPFKKCLPYPIIESGFAISSDLLLSLSFKTHSLNDDLAYSFRNARIIDDFRFNYFNATYSRSVFNENPYIASFTSPTKPNISSLFYHIFGFSFSALLSPFAKALVIIGEGIHFRHKKLSSQIIQLECFNYSNWTILTPPFIYHSNITLRLKC